MARQEIILSVFVASPSDVDEERNRLEEVIRELNIAWARELGIRLELVRWETHAYPSFGEDAQAVINEQIPDDYDLFIGLMWYHFGTPTGRAGSGTIEEFQRAKDRFDHDPSALQLMIYFKDAPAPVAPSKLDHTQLAKISEFRNSLGEEGCLYWSFASVGDFERLVRLHLIRQVQAWRSKGLSSPQPADIIVSESEEEKHSSETAQEDEPGLLDLMEKFEDEFVTLQEITERIANATIDIGEKMQARTAETQLFSSGPDSTNRKAAKRLIAKAAADMDQYVHRMEAELPFFSQHLNLGMNALIRASQMSFEITIAGKDLEQVKENLGAVRGLCEALTTVEEQITAFQQTVASLPKMTTTLNRAKRSVVTVLQRLINELRGGQTMAREAEVSFAALLEQK
jgi:hypothetical protein